MMGVLRWRLLVSACTIASRRSVTQSAGSREKKIASSLKAGAPAACKRLAGHCDAVATTAERLPDRAKAILANPEQDPSQHVRERYLALLAQMRSEIATLEPLEEAFEHFCHQTSTFAIGLFQCYDIAGLPRTNNELEHCFGVARVHERRATGRRGAIPGVVVRGSVRV